MNKAVFDVVRRFIGVLSKRLEESGNLERLENKKKNAVNKAVFI